MMKIWRRNRRGLMMRLISGDGECRSGKSFVGGRRKRID